MGPPPTDESGMLVGGGELSAAKIVAIIILAKNAARPRQVNRLAASNLFKKIAGSTRSFGRDATRGMKSTLQPVVCRAIITLRRARESVARL